RAGEARGRARVRSPGQGRGRRRSRSAARVARVQGAVPRLAQPSGGELMGVAVHGLDALEGETAFAFFVVRMREPVSREHVIEMLRYLAPLIPDPDPFIEELPEDLAQQIRIIAMPWTPPEAGHAVDGQRRLLESAGTHGVEAA